MTLLQRIASLELERQYIYQHCVEHGRGGLAMVDRDYVDYLEATLYTLWEERRIEMSHFVRAAPRVRNRLGRPNHR